MILIHRSPAAGAAALLPLGFEIGRGEAGWRRLRGLVVGRAVVAGACSSIGGGRSRGSHGRRRRLSFGLWLSYHSAWCPSRMIYMDWPVNSLNLIDTQKKHASSQLFISHGFKSIVQLISECSDINHALFLITIQFEWFLFFIYLFLFFYFCSVTMHACKLQNPICTAHWMPAYRSSPPGQSI